MESNLRNDTVHRGERGWLLGQDFLQEKTQPSAACSRVRGDKGIFRTHIAVTKVRYRFAQWSHRKLITKALYGHLRVHFGGTMICMITAPDSVDRDDQEQERRHIRHIDAPHCTSQRKGMGGGNSNQQRNRGCQSKTDEDRTRTLQSAQRGGESKGAGPEDRAYRRQRNQPGNSLVLSGIKQAENAVLEHREKQPITGGGGEPAPRENPAEPDHAFRAALAEAPRGIRDEKHRKCSLELRHRSSEIHQCFETGHRAKAGETSQQRVVDISRNP